MESKAKLLHRDKKIAKETNSMNYTINDFHFRAVYKQEYKEE